MIYHIVTTSAFERDLRQAASYISQKLYNPFAAERLIIAVRKAVESLKESPCCYPVVDDDEYKEFEIRKMVVQKNLVFYTVHNDTKIVVIHRFFNGRRDWPNLLKEYFEE